MTARAYLYLIITMAGWGGNAVAGKLAVEHVSPAMLTSLRWFVALAVILPFALPHLRREWPAIRAHAGLLILLGTVGLTLFNNLLYLALIYTSAINVAIEQAAMPLVIFVANFLLFRHRTTPAQLAGFAISVIGVALVASDGDLQRLLELDISLGDGLMMLAVLSYGLYTVGLRWKPKLHWLSLMAALAVVALFGSIPFTAFEAASGRLILPDLQGWLVVLYAGTVASIMSQALYIRGNELIGGNRAGLFINLVPIFGTVFAIAILGEAFVLYQLIALSLVLGGIALAERRNGRP